MKLKEPKEGTEAGFQILPESSYEGTLGDPEKIIWSSIKNMCSLDLTDYILFSVHNVKKKDTRSKVAKNIKLYVARLPTFMTSL